MNFPQRYKKNKNLLFLQIFGLALVVFSLMWNFGTESDFFSRGTLFIATPLWRAERALEERVASLTSIFALKKSLQKENELLKTQIDLLKVQLLLKDGVFEENEEVKNFLLERANFEKGTLALVLSKPNRSPYDTLVLDIGALNGVASGDLVLALGDVAIGKIEEVYSKNSRAKLFSSPGETLCVAIGKNNIIATAEGVGGGNFEIRLPRGISVTEGETISLSEKRSRIIGVVEKIGLNPTDPFQTIRFKNPINIFELKWVEVLSFQSQL